MDFAVVKGVSYALVHAPSLLVHMGTTQTVEREINPDSEYLSQFQKHLRSYQECVAYPANQVYIGNMTPAELAQVTRLGSSDPSAAPRATASGARSCRRMSSTDL